MGRKVISLSLPEELWEKLDAHYIFAGYASLSEYIRELVRNDIKRNPAEPVEDTSRWVIQPEKKRPSQRRW